MIEGEGAGKVPSSRSVKDFLLGPGTTTLAIFFLTTFFLVSSNIIHRRRRRRPNRQFRSITSKSELSHYHSFPQQQQQHTCRKHSFTTSYIPSTKLFLVYPALGYLQTTFPACWLRRIVVHHFINRSLNPLAWLQSTWTTDTRYLLPGILPKMGDCVEEAEEQQRQPVPLTELLPGHLIDPFICSCGRSVESSKHSGPSQPWRALVDSQKKQIPDIWDHWDDDDPWLPAVRESEHRMMLLTFAEHTLSRAKWLGFVGGTGEDRLRVIESLDEPFRTTLLKLVSDTVAPSPFRNDPDELLMSPWYSAADMASGLFHNKHHFNKCEWYIICVDWFQGWTGYTPSEALRGGVGNHEWEMKWAIELGDDEEAWKQKQPRLRRRFRAFSFREDGYERAEF